MTQLIESILDIARWAPSGDNTQPWRFNIIDSRHFYIIIEDTSIWCFYDKDGWSSILSVGALLENISIAASAEGMAVTFTVQSTPSEPLIIIASIKSSASIKPSHLLPFIKSRSTSRERYKTTALSDYEKSVLSQAVGDKFNVKWADGRKRGAMAWLLFNSAKIHLSIKECYDVHVRIIDWDCQTSNDKIPDHALGVSNISRKSMRWILKSWDRYRFFNRYFFSSLMPRIELGVLPALCCASHFMITSKYKLTTITDRLECGRALQRFWLTATALDIRLQPELAPLFFAKFSKKGDRFTDNECALKIAQKLPTALSRVFSDNEIDKWFFMGRVGFGDEPKARSGRLPLNELML